MIQAILRNKIKSEIREIFKVSEDTLTSSIIGTLLFLPSDFFLEILANSSYEKFNYSNFGSLQSIEFWPHWNSKNTTNSNFVEPDVFLRFKNADLIIEAKRHDDFQQYKGQWQNEIIAYFNEYERDDKTIVFLALGGIHSNQTEIINYNNNKIKIYKIRWKKILNEVENILNKMEKIEHYSENFSSSIRILHTIKHSFELHGFLSIEWFENINISFIENNKKLQYWQPNRNYFFNIRNNYTIEYLNIKIWKI